MDIFVDNKRHIFLFQEFANRGNGMAFIKQGNQATEQQIHSWSQIIYSALDYLGEKAISHRSLHPKVSKGSVGTFATATKQSLSS